VHLFSRLYQAVSTTLRYKLLALVLFPILLIMPIALVLAIYWGITFTYQQLYIKVNTDLSVSHDLFQRIQDDYLNELRQLSESYDFRVAFELNDKSNLRRQIFNWEKQAGFTYLDLVTTSGISVLGMEKQTPPTTALVSAFEGGARAGVEIFSHEQLNLLSSDLAKQLQLPLIHTDRARPTERAEEDRGMMIRALYPIKDNAGKVVAVLDGGLLINGNFNFVDAIRDLVYGAGSLLEGSIGTVTIFLEDVRINTNVPLRPGERALGTRVSNEVRTKVLEQGVIWIDRAFVVNDWYISSYEPIVDMEGKRVGMLYAGFLEKPFRDALWQALGVLILLFIGLMALSSILAIRGAKSIFKPLETMSAVARATEAGREERVGNIDSKDEIGELAREFDAMLDLLNERSHQIQQWADQLEEKVEERTAELQLRNEELNRTVGVLRRTRKKLVTAEKLAAVGELTAGIAHEINNPTAVMLGNMDLMTSELGSNADPVRGEIKLIIEQIYRIKDIINSLLQYARPDEYVGYLSQVNVNELVAQTMPLVKHLEKKGRFEIKLDLKADTPIEISGKELQQVMVNLIVNAAHSLREDDRLIYVETENWKEKGVVVRVRDHGVGMSPELVHKVFNPFYSTKGQGEGTGLGLSVSYGLIRRYGGNITVESVEGEGTVFSVWMLFEPEIINDEETITEQLHAIVEADRETL